MKSDNALQTRKPADAGFLAGVETGQAIPYRLVRSKRKTLAVHILPDGTVEVRAPLRMPLKIIEPFLEAKRPWIEQHSAQAKNRSLEQACYHADTGQTAFHNGTPYRIVLEDIAKLRWEQDTCILPRDEQQRRKVLGAWLRAEAKSVLPARLQELAAQAGYQYRSCSVGSAATRWGSCTGKDEIRLSCFLLLLPPECMDYVLLHELCHTAEHNHSPRFWHRVELAMPNAGAVRAVLRTYEKLLSPQIQWIKKGEK